MAIIPDNKRLVFDVDGTICSIRLPEENYKDVIPYTEMIDIINTLYENNWYIILHTARGMKSYNGNIDLINTHVKPVLEDWLLRHGVKYHELVMGKPFGNQYIDDKAQTPNMFIFGISEFLPYLTQKV